MTQQNGISLLKIGDPMPKFEAYDSDGNLVSSQDFLGAPTIIYFYPKDDTPGCTQEACDFRDFIDDVDTKGAILIGISPDSMESHQKFIEKYELNFELLSDPQLEIAKKFGAVVQKEGKTLSIQRSTFVINQDGIVSWMEKPVQIKEHAKRTIQALDNLDE